MGGGIIDKETGKLYEEFSNFFYENPPIKYNEKEWFYVESIYQALKTEDEKIKEEIRKEKNIAFVYQKGGLLPKLSKKEQKKNMSIAINAKLQEEKYRKLLKSTKGKLVGTDTSFFWRKTNGEIYEKIRKEIYSENQK